MAANPTGEGNDRLFCWEQVLKTNRVFRISQIFAPRDFVDRLLPLYAFFSSIEQICSGISDEDVAHRKLNWWQIECLHKGVSNSHHPVLKELGRTDALDCLHRDNIAQLLNGAETRLLANAPPDMEALKKMCIEFQRPQLELEIGVSGLEAAALEFEPDMLARNGLLQLIRESSHPNGQGSFWWIPLNTLARHGVSREDIGGNPQSPVVTRLMKEIITAGEQWGRGALFSDQDRAVDFSPARHVFAINGLYLRKLKRLRGATPDRFALELGRMGPGDLFAAWRSARRL